MLKLLNYIAQIGTATSTFVEQLDGNVRGMPGLTDAECVDSCKACVEVCPTSAISISEDSGVQLDLGRCIACGLCVQTCPTGTIVKDLRTRTAADSRDALVLKRTTQKSALAPVVQRSIFSRSLAVRVVSTGCTACDMEISAAGNPVFDMERFGVQVVASPRFADALLVTGPVPKAMHGPLMRCYEAMGEPKLVIAVGTCAISGGVHSNGYSEANGVTAVLPVDVFIPGCPPHPWSIIDGIRQAMEKRR